MLLFVVLAVTKSCLMWVVEHAETKVLAKRRVTFSLVAAVALAHPLVRSPALVRPDHEILMSNHLLARLKQLQLNRVLLLPVLQVCPGSILRGAKQA
jgi:hypothetical protein